MAVKESSIDCSIHRNVASKEKLKCFTFGVVSSNKFSYAPSIDSEESDASMAQNTKETELKLVKMSLTIGGVKADYAFDKKTNVVYDYNSYLAAKDMGGEPLMVGKIMEKDGSKSFVKMSAASAAESSAAAASSAKPKKAEGGLAKAKDSLDITKVVSSAVASLTSALSSSVTPAAPEAKPKP